MGGFVNDKFSPPYQTFEKLPTDPRFAPYRRIDSAQICRQHVSRTVCGHGCESGSCPFSVLLYLKSTLPVLMARDGRIGVPVESGAGYAYDLSDGHLELAFRELLSVEREAWGLGGGE